MFTVHSLGLAIFFCTLTMIGWGSWANTQKLAGRTRWPFELFYWDYAIGVLLFSILFMFTAGSFGSRGMSAAENFRQMSHYPIHVAMLSGALFNVANILLVVAIDAAGMAIAFPVGIGLALVIGTIASYREQPTGNASLLFLGVVFVLIAMIVSALAYRKLLSGSRTTGTDALKPERPVRSPHADAGNWRRGIIFAIIAGCLMGFFYPELLRAIPADFNSVAIPPGYLTPYTALFFFAVGLVVSNLVVNTIFMRAGRRTYGEYFRAGLKLHSIGILGGVIWMIALSLNLIASGVAGPAISYGLGQGATLVAAIWGVAIWKEFSAAPRATTPLIALMFIAYVLGLTLIGLATL